MPRKSYWLGSAKLPRFPKPTKDLKVDVAVVGGGITGITAAYLVKKAGGTVALLERDRCCRVDTGHTTAHVTYVTDTRLHKLVKSFGRDHAQAAWDAGRAAMEQIAALIAAEGIDCDHSVVPGYLHAPLKGGAKDEADRLIEDARLARELGFDAAYLESVPFVELPGVRFANQAKFHPLKYLAGLLQAIPGKGSHVFEGADVEEVRDGPAVVVANGPTISAKYVVIATHVPLMGKTGLVSATLFQTKLASYSSYAVGARVRKGTVPEAMFWDTADPYHYLRVERLPRHDYVIFGGEDHKTGQKANPDACWRRLEETLAIALPEAQVGTRWTGQVIETPDGLPLIGETADRQFVATGFSGNGITFGTLGGMMAVDVALGKKNPWQKLFDVRRKKLSGVWDYVKENLDYPYYFIKDKLAAAEGTSLKTLERGEGKILKLDGERIAAYRSREGTVTKLSPACTHMGCIVHWNPSDATWDCPCHGSRFKSTGEVLAGPAEAPLEKV